MLDSQLTSIRNHNENIKHLLDSRIADRLITFNYVLNHLGEWASDTTIGTDVKENIRKLNSGIENLKEQTERLHSDIDAYIDRQRQANEASINWTA